MQLTIRGFTFIELLVSLILLAILLLGFNASLIEALKQTQDAYYFSVATNQMTSFIEYLHSPIKEEDFFSTWKVQTKNVLPGSEVVLTHHPARLHLYWGNQPKESCIVSHENQIHCIHLTI